jgi:hypothetical protein
MVKMDREEGSAAVVYVYVMGIIAMVAIWIILNPEVDAFLGFANTGVISYSQDLLNSMGITAQAYNVFLIIWLLGWTLAAYIAALKARSGTV